MKATWEDMDQAIWIVQQPDGCWLVVCGACRRRLYRGPARTTAHRVANSHTCRAGA
jgi:hypothetical protein